MYRNNYVDALRQELVNSVATELSPAGLKYGYTRVPLEASIRWKPIVLILGNYSSGKSTLINELLGGTVQATGQAPTDDSFTVITGSQGLADGPIKVVESRDGKALLHDPTFPFEALRQHGDRFSAHFRLKRVNSPILADMAIIDTPGMLDSLAERDRGYNYQDVIRDLAQLADLVLVLFDPHKAGTVRESHESLRETLPRSTFEDRVMFVLNRIDECASLPDLLRVYGTLCWNLSQMTGRKDIPTIHLTYSASAVGGQIPAGRDYLRFLQNERDAVKNSILQAPAKRLDHLASYIELHGTRLCHYLESLATYQRLRRRFWVRSLFTCFMSSLLLAGIGGFFAPEFGVSLGDIDQTRLAVGLALLAIGTTIGAWVVSRIMLPAFHRNRLALLDKLTPLDNQSRRDSWMAIRGLVLSRLSSPEGVRSLGRSRAAFRQVQASYVKRSAEARQALAELGQGHS